MGMCRCLQPSALITAVDLDQIRSALVARQSLDFAGVMFPQANDYEKVRREQIQRNLERMQQLNVVGAAVKVAPPKREKPPKARGLPARKRVKVRPDSVPFGRAPTL